jgi:CheY-like chemotaxis protein/glycine cleavage system H lipoate-binding protein
LLKGSNPVAKPIDILVIDDEQVVRDAVCRVCKAGGLTAEAAGDARTGLEKVQRNAYRIVVCDIMLPELDGFHILDAMKSAGVRTPLIMITGYSTMQNAMSALKNGAIDFIPKPFTADELESAIRRGLQYKKFAQATVTRGLPEGDVSQFTVPCPAAYYRLGNLTWARTEQNGSGLIGIMDLYLKTTSGVKEIEFLDTGRELVLGSACAWITSEDNLIHSVLSPLSGRIVERNESLLLNPEVLEKDPYFAGWLYRIIPTDAANELQHLTCCIQDH